MLIGSEVRIIVEKVHVNGKYTEERQQLHRNILYMFIPTFGDFHDNPTAILLGGGSGSGKTDLAVNLIKSYRNEYGNMVHVDNDLIKVEMPEFKDAIASGNPERIHVAAYEVHEESGDMVNMLINLCIHKKWSFLYDGTMSYQPVYDELIVRLKEKSYHIEGYFVDIDPKIAYERALKRAEKSGRFVPTNVIFETNHNAPITFMNLLKHFDVAAIYDNNGAQYREVYSTDKTPQIRNKELFEAFLKKANNTHNYHE